MCTCGDHPEQNRTFINAGLSRRKLLKSSAAAIVSGGAASMLGQPALAQSGSGTVRRSATGAPAPRTDAANEVIFWGRGEDTSPDIAAAIAAERQTTSRTAGMQFKAQVRYQNALTTETLTLKPIHPLQVVIQNEAVQVCYSAAFQLDTSRTQENAMVAGHGGVGRVIEVGSAVKRVQVGDRVILSATPNCGVCGQCLRGHGDNCVVRLPALSTATMSDGTPVYMTAPPMGPAGHSEILVADEEWVVPVFTDLPAAELSMLICPPAVGLGITTIKHPVEVGSDVVIFGLGPLGIGAVQGARIQGAEKIIGIEPIAYRRELAMQLGATHVLDPNDFQGNELVEAILELTPDGIADSRHYLGERQNGALYAIEATAAAQYPLAPGVEAAPEDVNIFEQVYASVRSGGYVTTAGFPRGNVNSRLVAWNNKTISGGNFPGLNVLSDLPKFISLVERGMFDAKSMIGKVYGPDEMLEALVGAVSREVLTTVVDFT
ncbi:MAG: alcohol dehydrogenase catalytic domain-containing protein [Pseudohongiellaceae bacterium]